ncbi:MAG TPA: hypothetical protein VNG51_18685 [Ktedonobacteraceae bacterium]|nr:hypothetical protein [Ktedonobacteraceae bacterium]
MQVLTLEKNRGYLIAGIGAIVALFAFMFLPFISVASVSGGQATLLNVSDITQEQISIWMEFLAAVTAITIVALITFRPVPFSMLKTTAPIEIQIQWGNYLLILAGIFGVITPLIATFTLASLTNYSPVTSVSLASGSWLSLLGMVAVVIGGVLALRTINKVPQHIAGMYTQYPPVAGPQPWAAPADPYASVAPPQQWDNGQQVPPTQMQQWNAGQTGQPTLPSQQQWNPAQQVPPMQQPQWNTGQPTLPAQQPQWNTGQPMPPTQQQWNPGQQPPPGPPYQ